MVILATVDKFFDPAKVITIAASMQANDEDWTYRPVFDPKGTGYAKIAIFDEEGEFVGNV